jgi:hypothetical protein
MNYLTPAEQHRIALQNARLVLPETAEVLLADFLIKRKLLRRKHAFSLLCTHIEPDKECGYFDFAIWFAEPASPAIRKKFQVLKEKIQQKPAAAKAPHGSYCHICDLFFHSEQQSPTPATGSIYYGRIKVDLDLSAFHAADAHEKISGDWDYAGAEAVLQQLHPCHLQQISIDFGQEPELLFSLDFPAEKELQLPDFMLLEKITSRTLLVRLVPDKL